MATFLQLVNDVERESGTVAQSQRLVSVLSPVGRQEKIVKWTVQAWEMIQRERRDWTFRRKQFSHALVIGQTGYTATEMGITDFGGWLVNRDGYKSFTLYDSTIGRSDEGALRLVSYEDWLSLYDIGAPDSQRPNHIALGFDRKLYLGPPTDAAYVLRGWYQRSIQTLAANADEPYIDAEYHQAIVWRALMLMSDDDEDVAGSGSHMQEYRRIYSAMAREYTPKIEV